MKFLSLYSSHVLLAVLLASWCITIQVNGTEFLTCGGKQDRYFRIVSDEGSRDTSQLSGEVEICYNPSGSQPRDWYRVCGDSNWNDNTAAVVCQHLGFSETGASATFSNDTNGQVVVECTKFDRTSSTCDVPTSCTQRARVQCESSQCRNGETRLRNGNTEMEGLVEICFKHQWGTIHLDGWDMDEANVVCGQLGFSNEGADIANSGFDEGTGPIHFTDFQCDVTNGTEERLLDCMHDVDDGEDHNSDAGVMCMSASCMDGEVRLINGTQLVQGRLLNGRVEVCMYGRWGSVCDDHWDAVDAGVVCEQQGFLREGAIAVQQSAFGEPAIDPILLDGVQCDEMNANLLDCDIKSQGRTSCSFGETAGVICKACTNGEIRLVNGSREEEGRVEVCVNQQWSSVCDHSWSEADAIVTCRQLGYSDTDATNCSFGRGEGTIYFSNFECTGMESSLLSCDVSDLRGCDHSMDVGVICSVEQVSTTIMETTSTEPLEPESQEDMQSDSLVVAVAVLGVFSGVLLVALVVVIITCIILVKRSTSLRDSSNKQEYTEAEDTYEHELDNPVYGDDYDETLQPVNYDYVSTSNSEPNYDSVR